MPDAIRLKRADIETPALLVDLDVMERNLETMARFFCNRPAKLRPHFKNHRVLELASRQMDHGAIGITCARLWQAERLVSFGIRDILIANEIAGEAPVARFVELAREAPVLVAVDNPNVVADLARLAPRMPIGSGVPSARSSPGPPSRSAPSRFSLGRSRPRRPRRGRTSSPPILWTAS